MGCLVLWLVFSSGVYLFEIAVVVVWDGIRQSLTVSLS